MITKVCGLDPVIVQQSVVAGQSYINKMRNNSLPLSGCLVYEMD